MAQIPSGMVAPLNGAVSSIQREQTLVGPCWNSRSARGSEKPVRWCDSTENPRPTP